MKLRTLLLASLALIMSGCMTYEGRYAPSCLAYAGSEIQLNDGRYVWSRFTDQVVIDEDGNAVDPFPGFPREGASTSTPACCPSTAVRARSRRPCATASTRRASAAS